MNIPTAKYLKNKAGRRLASGKDPKQVVLVYSAISAGTAFLVTAVRYALSMQMTNYGGLRNIGARSMLSTAGTVLQILQSILLMCLGLGYVAAMLRIARNQYASSKTLKAGAERFWPLLASKLLIGLVYAGISIAVSFVAVRVFLLTPFANNLITQLEPIIAAGNVTPEMLLMDEALTDSLYSSLMMPMMIIYVVLLIPVLLFFSYRYRLVDYVIADNPGMGATAAIRQSRIMMRGNYMRLFKVDMSFWWYYVLRFLASGLIYADLILALFGIQLPFNETAVFFLTAIAYLAADFAINYYLMNNVAVTYALAYNSLVPKEESTGVVLGSIFDN